MDKFRETTDTLLKRVNAIQISTIDVLYEKYKGLIHQNDAIKGSMFKGSTFTPGPDELIKTATTVGLKLAASCVGLAIGDSVGAPIEFLHLQNGKPIHSALHPAPGNLQKETRLEKGSCYLPDFNQYSGFVEKHKRWGRRNGFRQGMFTDDTSMSLCIADSLIEKQTFDGADIRKRFFLWWKCGYNNTWMFCEDHPSIGLGLNISKSLDSMKDEHPIRPIYISPSNDAGNGSIMRLAPIVAKYHDNDLCNYAKQSSLTTHPSIIASECCCLLAYIIKACAYNSDESIQDAIQRGIDHYMDTFTQYENDAPILDSNPSISLKQMILFLINGTVPENNLEVFEYYAFYNWRSEDLPTLRALDARVDLDKIGSGFNGRPTTPYYFGSFSMDAMAMALWSVYHSTSFNDAILRCVNMGGDADSTAAVAGQIAGAYYGLDAVMSCPAYTDLIQFDRNEILLRGLLLARR